jgi:hypothetical protein
MVDKIQRNNPGTIGNLLPNLYMRMVVRSGFFISYNTSNNITLLISLIRTIFSGIDPLFPPTASTPGSVFYAIHVRAAFH